MASKSTRQVIINDLLLSMGHGISLEKERKKLEKVSYLEKNSPFSGIPLIRDMIVIKAISNTDIMKWVMYLEVPNLVGTRYTAH